MSNHVSGLSFLERLLPRSAQASRQDDGRPSQPPVMGLEERMALRRDMMCEVVADSLEEGGLPPDATVPASTLFEPVAPSELMELEQALRAGSPTVVGARVYHSDVAPLG